MIHAKRVTIMPVRTKSQYKGIKPRGKKAAMDAYEITDPCTGHRMIVAPREAWLLGDRFAPIEYQFSVPYLRRPTDYVLWISMPYPRGQEGQWGRGHFTVNHASTRATQRDAPTHDGASSGGNSCGSCTSAPSL